MKGFANIGNTCYLNSGLQMLIQNKDLCQTILDYGNKSLVLNKISHFILSYHNNESVTLVPNDIKMIVASHQHLFMGNMQQDSAEFIVFLLDIIDEEIKKIEKESNKVITGISKVFTLKSDVRVKCKLTDCLYSSCHSETNNYLLLDINPEFKSLDDCYRLSKSAERLDNIYKCEKCKKTVMASKRSHVTEWPSNLIIWLKRFVQVNNRFSKNSQSLDIPLIWRHGYHLQGAVIHSGGLNGGHYIYVGKNNNKYYTFNDSMVSEINENEFLNYINNAYIIYYKKSDTNHDT
jgi:ubiquitin C-terminal hydrolase